MPDVDAEPTSAEVTPQPTADAEPSDGRPRELPTDDPGRDLVDLIPLESSPDANDTSIEMRAPVGRPRRRRIVISIAVVTVLVTGGLVFTHTSVFDAKTIRIRGARQVSRDEILRLAGLARSTNVVYLDTAAAERAIEGDPWVRGVTVAKSYPSTIDIRIIERRPVGVTVGLGGTPALVATDGTVLGPAAASPALSQIESEPGAPPLTDDQTRDGARILGAMPFNLRRSVTAVTIREDGGASLTLQSGLPVEFGAPVDLPAKAQALETVLSWARARGEAMTYVDVTVASAPTARLVGGIIATP